MGVSTSSTRAVAVVTAAEVPISGVAGPPQDRLSGGARSAVAVRGGAGGRSVSCGGGVGRPSVLPEGWSGRSTRRGPARRGRCQEPAGPGRVHARRRPSPFVPVTRCVPAGRASAARPVPIRPRPGRAGSWAAPAAGLSAAARFVLVAALAAAAVVALGLLSDVVRQARVPETTALVRVHPGESLWQVARRAAPSADPGAVAARIVELNGLASPSVRDGDVLVSPVG